MAFQAFPAAIDILGVSEYERGLIPIIGLHAIEEEIGQPIELSTTNFDILCSTLRILATRQ